MSVDSLINNATASQQKPAEASVANARDVNSPAFKRIPFSTPDRKLEVPAVDGYYLHWFADRNVDRAMQAGYEFVNRSEVTLNQVGLGMAKSVSGNSDLGTRVSLIGTVQSADGPAERIYLMKIREEWRREDQLAIEKCNAEIIGAVFEGEAIVGKDGTIHQIGTAEYVKQAELKVPLLNRTTRKASIGRRR